TASASFFVAGSLLSVRGSDRVLCRAQLREGPSERWVRAWMLSAARAQAHACGEPWADCRVRLGLAATRLGTGAELSQLREPSRLGALLAVNEITKAAVAHFGTTLLHPPSSLPRRLSPDGVYSTERGSG